MNKKNKCLYPLFRSVLFDIAPPHLTSWRFLLIFLLKFLLHYKNIIIIIKWHPKIRSWFRSIAKVGIQCRNRILPTWHLSLFFWGLTTNTLINRKYFGHSLTNLHTCSYVNKIGIVILVILDETYLSCWITCWIKCTNFWIN